MKKNNIVTNAKVFGISESIIASGYPMQTKIDPLQSSTDKDLNRAYKLAQTPTGTGHDQFLTGIIVQFDLRFSLKAWTEMQRYHFVDFVSSQSTMHRILQFNIDEQMNEHVTYSIVNHLKELIAIHNKRPTKENYLKVLYNMPTGLELTARMTTNYRQLKTIYKQRKTHRLPEWKEFCKWIEELPLANLITGKGDVDAA